MTSGSDDIKSILKKRHALASNSASAASVGAANAGSTDDELEQEGECYFIFLIMIFSFAVKIVKVNSVQEAHAKFFAVHILKLEILQIT